MTQTNLEPNGNPPTSSPPNPNSDQQAAPETVSAMSATTAIDPSLSLPPVSWWGRLSYIGPGVILVGNIVGSGELIATPNLSARAGYSLLWLLLFSCVVKVFFQIEIGRYAIAESKTTLASFNELPGPRWRMGWLSWYWLIMMLCTLMQVAAMVGGTAQVLQLVIPLPIWQVTDSWHIQPLQIWTVFVGVTGYCLLCSASYQLVERVAMILVASFSIITLINVCLLQTTVHAMTWSDLWIGLSFQLPEDSEKGTLTVALMTFGVTGVGATELVMYPYWCLEKGYGRYTGRRPSASTNAAEADTNWLARAKGWIGVMQLDAWVSMVVFTVATVAFYILGAAFLHPRKLVPQDAEMIAVLSTMYTQTGLGIVAKPIFLIGAFCVFFSTFFVATAANSRMTVDWFILGRFLPERSPHTRSRYTIAVAALYTTIATLGYLLVANPVFLVGIGAIMQALMLPFIAGAVLYFAHYRTEPRLRGGWFWYTWLWLAFILMTLAAVWMAKDTLNEKFLA